MVTNVDCLFALGFEVQPVVRALHPDVLLRCQRGHPLVLHPPHKREETLAVVNEMVVHQTHGVVGGEAGGQGGGRVFDVPRPPPPSRPRRPLLKPGTTWMKVYV